MKFGYFFETFLDGIIQSMLTICSNVHDSVSLTNGDVLLNY